jgi:tetratricopeptide (TPR) repeat protein
MTKTKTLKRLSDRTMNRLIVGAVLVLAIGVPVVGAIYLLDRYVATPPPIVDQKVSELEAGVRAAPNNLALRLRLAGAYVAADRNDEAVAQFDEVLTAAATLKADESAGIIKSAHLGRADARRLAGDLDAAVADYQFVVDVAKDGEFAPVDTELQSAYFQLGSIALTQARSADAVVSLQAALKINRTDADTLHLLGRAYLGLGDAEQAVEPLREAILFVPIGWCEPYGSLGEAYDALGQVDEAIWASSMAAFCANEPGDVRPQLQSITDGPAALDAFVGLGLVEEVSGDAAAAADWYRQALAIAPEDFTAASGLSRVAATNEGTGPAPTAAPSAAPEGNS